MRVAWGAVWAAVWIAGACRPSSSDVTWSSDVAPPTSQQAIWVDFADGSRLGGASVERTGPASAQARFHWAPSKSLDGAQIELRLFPSNGGASIPVNAVRLRGRGEEAATVQVAFDDEALRQAHPHWLMAQLQRPDGEAVAAAAFPGDWVSLGAVRPAGVGPLTEHPPRAAAHKRRAETCTSSRVHLASLLCSSAAVSCTRICGHVQARRRDETAPGREWER